MKIHPRFFPGLILTAFLLFFLLGLALGFLPQHPGGREGRGRTGANLPAFYLCQATCEMPV
jgi:hypothetical protein